MLSTDWNVMASQGESFNARPSQENCMLSLLHACPGSVADGDRS